MKQFSLEEYKENPSRKIVTRKGKNVRILCIDMKGAFSIVAVVESEGSVEKVIAYTEDGKKSLGNKSSDDLMFENGVSEQFDVLYQRWMEIYSGIGLAKNQLSELRSELDATRDELEKITGHSLF